MAGGSARRWPARYRSGKVKRLTLGTSGSGGPAALITASGARPQQVEGRKEKWARADRSARTLARLSAGRAWMVLWSAMALDEQKGRRALIREKKVNLDAPGPAAGQFRKPREPRRQAGQPAGPAQLPENTSAASTPAPGAVRLEWWSGAAIAAGRSGSGPGPGLMRLNVPAAKPSGGSRSQGVRRADLSDALGRGGSGTGQLVRGKKESGPGRRDHVAGGWPTGRRQARTR